MNNASEQDDTIELSQTTVALLDALKKTPKKILPPEGESYEVSQAVTFLGVLYENLRNAVEFSEEHLIRRMAIGRILRRRLGINPDGKGEGENLVRELMWGNYIPKGSIGTDKVANVQKIIDDYVFLFSEVKKSHTIKNNQQLYDIVTDLLSCEIEESLSYVETYTTSAYLYFFYHILREKILIKEISDDDKDTFFYMASESALLKNDPIFIRYHLFIINFGPLNELSREQIKKIAGNFHIFYKESDRIMKNPYNEKLVKYAQRQAAPFRILYHILENADDPKEVFSSRTKLNNTITKVCNDKYKEIGAKLNAAAIRSIIYIFFTKMILVLLVELPLSQLIFNEVSLMTLGINTLFPPVLMGLIVSVINPPSQDNTKHIYARSVDILNKDPSFETTKIEFSTSRRERRPTLFILFSVMYIILFTLIFGGIYTVLDMLNFNILSKTIFIFFISVVTFFAYRIRQMPKEYILESEGNPIISLITFLFLPIIYVGKVLSKSMSRINLFILFFDTLIEAPFKVFIDVFEEWSRFVKARKDELV